MWTFVGDLDLGEGMTDWRNDEIDNIVISERFNVCFVTFATIAHNCFFPSMIQSQNKEYSIYVYVW